jgi:hypothetical protein
VRVQCLDFGLTNRLIGAWGGTSDYQAATGQEEHSAGAVSTVREHDPDGNGLVVELPDGGDLHLLRRELADAARHWAGPGRAALRYGAS